jgi:hypothetical protein
MKQNHANEFQDAIRALFLVFSILKNTRGKRWILALLLLIPFIPDWIWIFAIISLIAYYSKNS